MTKRKMNIHQTVIKSALALPIRDPRPIPETVKYPRVAKIKKFLQKNISTVAADTYDAIARDADHVTVIEKSIPLADLQKRIAMHAGKILAEAVIAGNMPVAVHMTDRFSGHVDFGHGRVIEIGVRLHEVPIIERPTVASIVVTESELIEPWTEFFDPIPESQRIKSANLVNGTGATLKLEEEVRK